MPLILGLCRDRLLFGDIDARAWETCGFDKLLNSPLTGDEKTNIAPLEKLDMSGTAKYFERIYTYEYHPAYDAKGVHCFFI